MATQQPKKVAGGAFGQFLAEKRPELTKECKGQPITAITKLASERFRTLSEAEKAVYQEKFEAAKAQYDEKMKAFIAGGGELKARKSRKTKGAKKEKDPNKPKRPAQGAYGCFVAKNRAAFQEQTKGQPVTAVSKLAALKWKELSAEEKKVFEKEFEAKRAAYYEAMKSYVPPAKDDTKDEKKDEKKAQKRGDKDGDEPAPKRRRRTKAEMEAARAEAKEGKEGKEAESPKAKAKAKATSPKGKPDDVKLEKATEGKAEKMGMKDALVKLAARPDVIATGKSQGEMLKALEENRGLVHKAKKALLGA